jgi:hypothetical protein
MIAIVIDKSTGNARAIYSDDAAGLYRQIGTTETRRASHVEPDGDQWAANMAPVAGPVLIGYQSRAEALAAEVQYLIEHGLPAPV